MATRLWAEELSIDPKLSDDRRGEHRYNAARAAALRKLQAEKVVRFVGLTGHPQDPQVKEALELMRTEAVARLENGAWRVGSRPAAAPVAARPEAPASPPAAAKPITTSIPLPPASEPPPPPAPARHLLAPGGLQVDADTLDFGDALALGVAHLLDQFGGAVL